MKILVVDDNREFCDNTRDILELEGHTVAVAYGGAQAVMEVKRDPPELVIMDMKMPVIDGVTALKEIRKIAPRLPVIMVSGFSLEGKVGEARLAGAAGFLTKPLDFNKLFALAEEARKMPWYRSSAQTN